MTIRSTWPAAALRTVVCALLLASRSASAWDADDRPATTPADPLVGWLDLAQTSVPREAGKYSTKTCERLAQAADGIEQWIAQIGALRQARGSDDVLKETARLLDAKARIDKLLDEALSVRSQFAALPEERQRDALRAYLRTVALLIDLSGRVRYLSRDALNATLERLPSQVAARQRLVDLLLEHRSSIGAHVMAKFLTQPGGSGADARKLQTSVLELIEITGQNELLDDVVRLLDAPRVAPELTIAAAETIRAVGLPQEPRPGTIEKLPPPAITARGLSARLARVDASRLSPEWAKRHAELLAWSQEIAKQGVSEQSYRIGDYDVRPGDWLLMRNPSPYNLFTDLSPGLFTHVGVVATERGADGIRRMVLVDLPERGTRLPATNVEAFLPKTLHYVFVRHPDAEAASAMGRAAADLIGNECQFDLTFRTERVLPLEKKPLADQKVHTYCAGLLLLCALQTEAPRGDFFPLTEHPAGGKTTENLHKLGLAIGKDVISPSGALFSTKLEIVGRREPMYDPRREVEEAVFDAFAKALEQKTLAPSPGLYQSLRQKLAEASRTNRALAQALAKAVDVNANMDLVAAAKAAGVVETLDEIAFGASRDYLAARAAMMAPPADDIPPRERRFRGDLDGVERYQRRHADLYRRWSNRQITPRQLRQALVEYYVAQGERELGRRFFAGR